VPRWLVVVVVAVLTGAVVVAGVIRSGGPASRQLTPVPSQSVIPSGPPCVPVGTAQSPPVVEPKGGLLITRPGAGRGGALDRCDRTAVDGPWTVVVRAASGSLGRSGAVVTFPVDPPAPGRRVDVNGATGTASTGSVGWPVGGAHARIRGDLGEAALVAIAAGTTVVAGRPIVRPPAGYGVVTSGPYRPPSIHELRFGSARVGEADALGNGLAYTGLTSGGGFEDQLYAVPTDDGGSVDGRPAVVSPVFGGNATLAWEPAPGVVAFVGYSGAELDDAAVAALRRLAAQTRPLTDAQWRAAGPQTVDQVNQPG
jgi:hypothetical protein